MWMGDGQYRLAPALVTLIGQLERSYPAQQWQQPGQTGTIGDEAHRALGSASDHNPWLDGTVRALDVEANTPGGPNAEALFAMVNRMYAARDPRVYPNGYAIFNERITDWDNPGGFHTQTGDPHFYHVHISVSQNPAGFNSTATWPLASETAQTGPSTPVQEDDMTPAQDKMLAYVYTQTRAGVGQGQSTPAGTQKATLATAQAVYNQQQAILAQLRKLAAK